MTTQIAALDPGWRLFVYALLGIGALGCWWFIGRYTSLYRWWRNDIGRHLIALSSCLGLFYTYYAAVVFWPDLPGRTGIRLALFAALTGTILWRVAIFERVARLERLERKAAQGSSAASPVIDHDRS